MKKDNSMDIIIIIVRYIAKIKLEILAISAQTKLQQNGFLITSHVFH